MPKNVIKENLNIESIEKTGEVQVLPQNKSYILSIKDYSMMLATRPEPTVRPPSRSVGVVFRNLFVTDFAVFYLILWIFYLLFLLFPGEM